MTQTPMSPIQRFVVIHKTTKSEPAEYIGPFVSERLAEEYIGENLPIGNSVIRPLRPRDMSH